MRVQVMRLFWKVVASVMVITLLLPIGIVHAASTLNGHPVVLDGSGKIIPWTANPGDGYGTVIDNAWNYLLNSVPNDPNTGKPAYYSQSSINPDTQQMDNWPNNPAGMFSMLTESALKYYAYSGNIAPVHVAENLANWELAHGMTTSTDNWANVPYSSGDAGSLTYAGASYGNSTGVGDGAGYLQPDKIGEAAVGWMDLYQFDGNTAYRDAAIAAADALAAHIRPGTATQSPWPFRVNAATGAVRENYTADVIYPIELFDDLINSGLGNTAAYQTARTSAWNWMMTYPMQNNIWSNYFEDVPVKTDTGNYTQYIAMTVARYLMEHQQYDPSWQTHVRGLITWVESTFAVTDNGANTIKEQEAYMYTMGSHTSRYAAVNAMLAEFTGDQTAASKAYYSLNWATYMARANGVDIVGPSVLDEWFTDGYGDYIQHFLNAMQAQPQWAPASQTHMTGSTSIVTNISYTPGGIQYTTADNSATDSFRVNFTPASVLANGTALTQNGDLNQEGWTYNASNGVLRVRHDASTNIQIVSGAPGNFPPTVSLTAPTNGTNYSAGTDVTLTATASDSDGTVTKVDFYNGGTLLGTSTTAPYSYTWSSVPAGNYTLSAVATDNSGAVTTSSTASITVAAPSTLPAPWQDSDVGSTGVSGSGSYTNGTFSVAGSGASIGSTADAFNFVYQQLNGDGSIVARVATQQNTNTSALAGVMFRESLSAGSRSATIGLKPTGGASFVRRTSTGGSSSTTTSSGGSAPYWVKLTRSGNVFSAYKSSNGTSWTQVGSSVTIAMNANAYVGLAVTSHNNTALSTATFDNVNAAAAADTTPPVISGITASNVSQNGANISWTTNEASDSQVEYGTTTAYGSSTALNTSLVTAHSIVVPALDASTTYHYRVKSRDAAGNLATSGDNTFTTPTPPDITPPSQPSGLTAPVDNSDEVDLSWNASTDDTAVTGYRIYRDGTQIGTTATTTYRDTTVSQQTTYAYTVAAYDAAGNISAASDPLSVTTPQFFDFIAPTAPTSLSASAQNGPSVKLSWTASTDNVGVAGYQVWRDGTQLTTTSATNFTDTNVAAGETHSYYVVAYDAASNNSQPSNTASVTLPVPDTTPPTAPSNLFATNVTSTALTLNWSASTDNVGVTGYRVFRGGVQVGTTSATNFTDSGLSANTAYTYTVQAIDAASNTSDASNPLPITTAAAATNITIDKSVVVKQTTASTSLTAPSFSTTAPNELLVAFIATDGGSGAQTISGVTGGGLTWTLRKRVNTQHGTSEIWTATAPAITGNISVVASHSGSYQGMMEVVAFQHAGIGTTGGGNGSSGAPTASLTTTVANSWVWGVGNDWDRATARTVGANQTKVDEMLSSLGDTYWVQRQTATTPSPGTNVTINDTAPTADQWNLATIEIVPV